MKSNSFVWYLVLASILLYSGSLGATPPGADVPDVASATPSIQTIPPGKDKIAPIKKGDAAPFDGQLFDNDTALRWGNWLLQYKLRLNLDVEQQKKILGADVELWKHKYEISEKKYETVTLDYQNRLAASESLVAKYRTEIDNPSWYRSPVFGFAMGVVFTGVCFGAGFYAYHGASK